MRLARTLWLVLPVLPLEVIPGVRLSNLRYAMQGWYWGRLGAGLGGGLRRLGGGLGSLRVLRKPREAWGTWGCMGKPVEALG